ncbi:MAG: alpha/beta fold hydrolase [Elusimicrobia bacterium]|nr:alpha/beta fold hydrolase [Elusimicrobiota bacterium]
MILWTAAVLAGLAVLLLAVAWWGSGLVMHPPAMSPMWVFPEQFGLRYEKADFATKDGLELKGWLLPSPNGDKRTILMCHGWGDNKGELLKMTYFLNENAGFNLFYFDFRSHGESGGEFTTIGGLETQDFDAAVEWLRKNKPELADRIGVFGLSMGAAVTVASLPNHPDLRCAVVESPFSDYRGVVERWSWNHLRVPRFPLIDVAMWILRRRVGDRRVDDFNPVESAPRIAPRPLFVIGGERDDLMPEDDVRRVFDAALEPKQLWIVPGAFHAKCREAAGVEYDTRVSGFFDRNL